MIGRGTFWGKLDRDEFDRVVDFHPLDSHSIDVACVTEALLTRTILRRRLERLTQSDGLSTTDVARLVVIAALHDLGKFNSGFQRRGHDVRAPRVGHTNEISLLFGARSEATRRLHSVLESVPFDAWFDPPEQALSLLLASMSHHGRPVASRGATRFDVWLPATDIGIDPFVGIAGFLRVVREAFPDAYVDSPPTRVHGSLVEHAFAGIVQLADWIGSDRRFFPFDSAASEPRIAFARRAAAQALDTMGLDPSGSRSSLGSTPVAFERVAPGRAPRAAQLKILGLSASAEPRLIVLEAETGAGKTEAALICFARAYQRGEVDGMYFALPTRTAATQLHRRIVAATSSLFPEAHRPPVVLAVPGYLQVDDATGTRLPGFEVLWNDSPKDQDKHRRWASENPKRYLAGAIVVGTIDQVLLSSLAVSHAHLRASSLLRHLLVVDEVHASDEYMNRLLGEALKAHFSAGGHALLMSATLGSATRHRLEASIRSRDATPPGLEEAVALPYPALWDVSPGRSQHMSIDGIGLAKSIDVSTRPWIEDAAAIAEESLRFARAGARVIILRNTVAACIATQLELESRVDDETTRLLLSRDGQFVAHHGRFASGDRRYLDDALEDAFGIPGAPGGFVVCATQTIQQSLDLDSDIMLTDLAPVDVLLQRAGRVHRHVASRPRPAGFEVPRLIVMVPERRDLGTYLTDRGNARGPAGIGTVYPDLRMLDATWGVVDARPTWRVPEDSRILVELALHPEALRSLVDGRDHRWQAHQEKMLGTFAAEQSAAELQLITRNKHFDEVGVLFPSDDIRMTTRLGAEAMRIAFASPVRTAFGVVLEGIDVPRHLAPPLDTVPPIVSATTTERGGAFSFAVGDRTFVYDRLGLRRT